MSRLLCFMMLLVALLGCARKQMVEPLRSEISSEICIIEDVKVRKGFLPALKDELEKLGYQIRVIPQGSATADCQTTVTYTGRWSWDVTIYLGYASIKAYKDGFLLGSAEYSAPQLNFKKWINAEAKIRELVRATFPPVSASTQSVAVAEDTIASKELHQLEEKANAGDANAQFDLGLMYYYGDGVKKDLLKAKYYYKQATAQGHVKAKKELKFLE